MSDERFLEIAADTIDRAEKVDCDFDQFIDGLAIIIDGLLERYNLAKSERAS